jgi:hypothetical protein
LAGATARRDDSAAARCPAWSVVLGVMGATTGSRALAPCGQEDNMNACMHGHRLKDGMRAH